MECSTELPNPYRRRYSFIALTDKEELFSALRCILVELKKQNIYGSLSYILSELIDNANKANIKRVHFNEMKLDITNPSDYEKGMTTFAEKSIGKEAHYASHMAALGLFLECCIEYTTDTLRCCVTNSGVPTTQEIERMHNRIQQSAKMRDATEAFLLMRDDSERAGMGTVTTIMALRSMGTDEKAFHFSFNRETKQTAALVAIPLNVVSHDQVEHISDAIAHEIATIPQYPRHILELRRLVGRHDTTFSTISSVIMRDPALTAELLKIVNSARYVLPKRVTSIQNAVSLIGIRGIQNLLLSFGAQKIMDEKYGNLDFLWNHSFRCASYAYHIAVMFGHRSVLDDVYAGAILHDIGVIIMRTVHPGLQEQITRYCSDRGVSGNVIENLTVGSSHAAIGAHLAGQWNFPDPIIKAIEFHHQPFLAPDEHQLVTSIVYCAECLTTNHEKNGPEFSVYPEIRKQFGISDKKAYDELSGNLEDHYQEQLQKNKGL